jgi:hypothetical protein
MDVSNVPSAQGNSSGNYLRYKDESSRTMDKLRSRCVSEGHGNGRPGIEPVVLLGVLIFQFLERVPDRQAAELAKYHLGWKLALNLRLGADGFKLIPRFDLRIRRVDNAALFFSSRLNERPSLRYEKKVFRMPLFADCKTQHKRQIFAIENKCITSHGDSRIYRKHNHPRRWAIRKRREGQKHRESSDRSRFATLSEAITSTGKECVHLSTFLNVFHRSERRADACGLTNPQSRFVPPRRTSSLHRS